jgi:phosphatidylinositol phospholipase C, delta
MRFGPDASYYCNQFQLPKEAQSFWITIFYIREGNYKTLHLLAPDVDVFTMWRKTLQELHAIRQELMSGLGNIEMRQALWEKHYWKGSDVESDQKLTFDEIEGLCKRLNNSMSRDDILHLFQVREPPSGPHDHRKLMAPLAS